MTPPNEIPLKDTDVQPWPGAVKMWSDAHGAVMWEARPGTWEYANDYWAFYYPLDQVRSLRRQADRQREYAAEALDKAATDIWFAHDDLRATRGAKGPYAFYLLDRAALFRKFARAARKTAALQLEQSRMSLERAAEIEARLTAAAAA